MKLEFPIKKIIAIKTAKIVLARSRFVLFSLYEKQVKIKYINLISIRKK